jgi:hypothetical protein
LTTKEKLLLSPAVNPGRKKGRGEENMPTDNAHWRSSNGPDNVPIPPPEKRRKPGCGPQPPAPDEHDYHLFVREELIVRF